MTPELDEALWNRDRGCVASRIDPRAGPCFDASGRFMSRGERAKLERDHVYGRERRRVEELSDFVLLCPGHHRGIGWKRGFVWATAHRDELQAWAARNP